MTALAVVVTIDPEGQVPDQLLGAVQSHSIVIEAHLVFKGGEKAARFQLHRRPLT